MSRDGEPLRASADSNNSVHLVEQDEAAPTLFNEYQGWSSSSKWLQGMPHQRKYTGRFGITTKDYKKFFYPGEKKDFCALPSRPISLSGEIECTIRAVMLWFDLLVLRWLGVR